MLVLHLLYALLAFAIPFEASAALIASGPIRECEGKTVASEAYIGEAKNVKVEYVHCANSLVVDEDPTSAAPVSNLVKRQSNVCGAPCTTYCWTPAGGGPDPNDCAVIQDALLYDSQNVGALFNITASGTPTDMITMTYSSCLSYFLNQEFSTIVYCRTDWAALVNYIAFNCQATQNAHGGLCVANDQGWYVQVQHS